MRNLLLVCVLLFFGCSSEEVVSETDVPTIKVERLPTYQVHYYLFDPQQHRRHSQKLSAKIKAHTNEEAESLFLEQIGRRPSKYIADVEKVELLNE